MGKNLYTVDEIKELMAIGYTIDDIKEMTKAAASAEEEVTVAPKKSTKYTYQNDKGQRVHPLTGRPVDKNGKTINPTRDGMKFVDPFRMDNDKNEVQAIYNAMKSDRNKLLVIVGVYLAFRVSDITQLTFGQIREMEVTLKEKKTKNYRTVEINEEVRAELEKWKDKDDSDWCFPSRKGNKPITRQQAHDIISQAAERIGLIKRAKPVDGKKKGEIITHKRYGTHSLRKSLGYFLWKQGDSITTIMELYGHSAEATTRRYLGIDQAEKNKKYRSVNFGIHSK